MSFKDKVVIVTGASSGIGAAAAIAFSAAGARVAMVGRDNAKLDAVAAKCANPLIILADVSKDDDAKRIIDETIKKFGQLDVLVNNAGLMSLAGSLLQGDMMKSYDTIMNVNVRAVVHLTNLAAPHLIKTKGNVVNISSVAGHLPSYTPLGINYCVSKAALNHFTACAATELGPHGVRVNAICPGPVRTDLLTNAQHPKSWDDLAKFTLLNKVSEANEIADLILYLASDKAKSITGSNHVIDCGTMLKRA
ncbi:A-factor type gamma-butyrolactone 1'-reductase (1S-forming)-like [Vanessa atalanta]|uniref:A-factor type gamma-butyrolactone 1'-reductase (1S-forming)-like n=1 Tax=Vanessa atalanta TaxID=42275 RepID=UPI001FCE06BB|nr:A-factor type gamma-butyrolactone 1'-reductase (1S-forming)-like [Vanessa atalanta]